MGLKASLVARFLPDALRKRLHLISSVIVLIAAVLKVTGLDDYANVLTSFMPLLPGGVVDPALILGLVGQASGVTHALINNERKRQGKAPLKLDLDPTEVKVFFELYRAYLAANPDTVAVEEAKNQTGEFRKKVAAVTSGAGMAHDTAVRVVREEMKLDKPGKA